MTINQITKEEFDKRFKGMITETEKLIKEEMEIYKVLLDFRSQYRKDYLTHRIIHYIENNILKYKKQEKRNMGFNYKGNLN